MRYPSQWAKLVPVVRSIIGSKHADVKVGIGLNFNHLHVVDSQYYSAQAVDPSDGYWLGSGQRAVSPATLQNANAFSAAPIDGAGVRGLVSEVIDFVGVSAYAPYSAPGFPKHEFENSAFNLGDALRTYANGVDLAALVRAGKIELHYSEFGLGGGENGNRQVCFVALQSLLHVLSPVLDCIVAGAAACWQHASMGFANTTTYLSVRQSFWQHWQHLQYCESSSSSTLIASR
jgi:hypothetical protein